MKIKSLILWLVICLLTVPVIIFLFLQSSTVINKISYFFKNQIGFEIIVKEISITPPLRSEFKHIYLKGLEDRNLDIYITTAQIEGGINQRLQGVIERAILVEPKIFVSSTKSSGGVNLSFIRKLPPIEFLEIERGEIEFQLNSAGQSLKFSDIKFKLFNFSPQRGGKLHFKCQIKQQIRSGDVTKNIGYAEGNFEFITLSPTPVGKGQLKLNMSELELGSISLQEFFANISLDLNKGVWNVSTLSPVVSALRIGKEEISIRGVLSDFTANYDLKNKELNFKISNSKVPNLGVFGVNFDVTIEQDYSWGASIKINSVDFAKSSQILRVLLPDNYQKWSYQGTGSIEALIKGHYKDRELSGAGRMIFLFKQGGISSPKGNKAVHGVSGKIILDIQLPTLKEKGHFDISSEIFLGELLFNSYYNDLNGRRLLFEGKGNLHDRAFKKMDFAGCLNLFQGGLYPFTLSIESSKWNFQLKTQDIPIEELFSLFLRDYIEQNIPTLSDLHISGLLQSDLNVYGENKVYYIDGTLNLKNYQFLIPNKISISGHITLPFSFPDTLSLKLIASKDDIKQGSLHFKEIKTKFFHLTDIIIPFLVSGDNLSITQSVDIPHSDWKVRILKLNINNMFSHERLLSSGIAIRNLELSSFIESLYGAKIPAKLDLELPEIVYKDDEMITRGGAVLQIFGGKAYINNIHGRKLLSKGRVIGGDINFEEIRLDQLTENIKLGKMTGVIMATLNDFEIEYGQPSKFKLEIDSVKKDGIPQSISVDAIENISLIGSGSKGIGVLLRSGINNLFKHYAYSRIGIHCSLENDIFTLRGKIKEESKEYLIRKGFLIGIDVVNQNPENKISFKDMVERINRVFEKGL